MQSRQQDPRIRVALVEDEIDFQDTLIEAVQVANDLDLLGVAASRADALQMLRTVQADVLVVDLGLPDGSGIDVIRVAHEKAPACAIMVYTIFDNENDVIRSLEAGASGYLIKDDTPVDMANGIRILHAGGSLISPLIARQILVRFREDKTSGQPEPSPQVSLSGREREVLLYITKGFTSDEIATLLSVSRHTVLTYVRRIYAKLNVTSKAEAIYEARYLGIVREPNE